jgi:hypothetical protein
MFEPSYDVESVGRGGAVELSTDGYSSGDEEESDDAD